MAGAGKPESKDTLVAELTARAVNLWGEERAQALSEEIENTAARLAAVGSNLPHFEEVPTLTWHNHP